MEVQSVGMLIAPTALPGGLHDVSILFFCILWSGAGKAAGGVAVVV